MIVEGFYNGLEIWDSKQWDLYKQKAERSAGDMAERLGELGV